MHYSTLTICIYTIGVFIAGCGVGGWVLVTNKNAQLNSRTETMRAQAKTILYLKRQLDEDWITPKLTSANKSDEGEGVPDSAVDAKVRF